MNRRPPSIIVVLGTLGVLFIATPLVSLVWRTPWSSLGDVLTDPVIRDAVWLSITSAAATTAIALVVGVPLSLLLADTTSRIRGPVLALVTLPIVLPPVAGGIALLSAFGREGLVGGRLDAWFDITLLGTPAAVVMAQLFVSLPFLVVTVESALSKRSRAPELAAATLGAGPNSIIWRVTLPAIGNSIVAGATLTWARALGELGATLTFAGSLPARSRTVPSSILLLLETDPDAARTLSVLLLSVAALVLFGLRRRWTGIWSYWRSSATSPDR